MSSSIYRINIIRAPIIFAVKELMEETFFSFMRFDVVIPEMLDITGYERRTHRRGAAAPGSDRRR